jgi:hypothetical protein
MERSPWDPLPSALPGSGGESDVPIEHRSGLLGGSSRGIGLAPGQPVLAGAGRHSSAAAEATLHGAAAISASRAHTVANAFHLKSRTRVCGWGGEVARWPV